MDIPIIDVMTPKLVFVSPDDSVLTAVKKMINTGLGNVLVMVDGKLKGILTEKDVIVKVAVLDKKISEFKVKDIMTSGVVTAKLTATIQEVARLMIDKNIRRVPIKDKGKIIGVVTNTDILRVQPGLIDVLVERFKYDNPRYTDSGGSGVCEVCNSFSKNLVRFNGRLVCLKCKKKI